MGNTAEWLRGWCLKIEGKGLNLILSLTSFMTRDKSLNLPEHPFLHL